MTGLLILNHTNIFEKYIYLSNSNNIGIFCDEDIGAIKKKVTSELTNLHNK